MGYCDHTQTISFFQGAHAIAIDNRFMDALAERPQYVANSRHGDCVLVVHDILQNHHGGVGRVGRLNRTQQRFNQCTGGTVTSVVFEFILEPAGDAGPRAGNPNTSTSHSRKREYSTSSMGASIAIV